MIRIGSETKSPNAFFACLRSSRRSHKEEHALYPSGANEKVSKCDRNSRLAGPGGLNHKRFAVTLLENLSANSLDGLNLIKSIDD